MQAQTAYGIYSSTILSVTRYRMTDILHMNPDLIFPAGIEVNLHQGVILAVFNTL